MSIVVFEPDISLSDEQILDIEDQILEKTNGKIKNWLMRTLIIVETE